MIQCNIENFQHTVLIVYDTASASSKRNSGVHRKGKH